MSKKHIVGVAGLAGLALVALAGRSSADPLGPGPGGQLVGPGPGGQLVGPGPGSAAVRLSDAEIASVLLGMSGTITQQTQFAQSQASSYELRNFASERYGTFNTLGTQLGGLFGQIGIAPVVTPVVEQVISPFAFDQSAFAVSGSSFERAFLQRSIPQWTAMIGLIDTVLLPSAQSAELRYSLQSFRSELSRTVSSSQVLVSSF